jgi:formiminoglutamase
VDVTARASAWPHAAELLVDDAPDDHLVVALLGISTWSTSVSPRSAVSTPDAVRSALSRFSTYLVDGQIDLLDHLRVLDLGDLADPDGRDAARRAIAVLAALEPGIPCAVLGGDNSATVPGLLGRAGGELGGWGLVTVDPHLDVREGHSNGSPVRELIESGLDPRHVVQVGTADFVNSRHDASWASSVGVTRFTRGHVNDLGLEATLASALAIAGDGGREVYVDLDVDSVDQAAAPGCPASAPGGLSAWQFRRLARLVGRDARVGAVDLTEVDVERDAPDLRTVRLVTLALLEFLAGVVERDR